MNTNLINKQIPKFFHVTISYVTGDSETLKCASWNYQQDFIEYLTTDNTFIQVIKNNIQSLKYDKDYTKIIEACRKQKEEEVKKK